MVLGERKHLRVVLAGRALKLPPDHVLPLPHVGSCQRGEHGLPQCRRVVGVVVREVHQGRPQGVVRAPHQQLERADNARSDVPRVRVRVPHLHLVQALVVSQQVPQRDHHGGVQH